MESRLRDLISTAERQFSSQSYDAAIDTYRTALAELSGDAAPDMRAGIEGRLEAARHARENSQRVASLLAQARYQQTTGPLTGAFAAVAEALSLEPSNAAAAQVRDQLLEAMPELAAAPPIELAEVAPVELPASPHVETMEPPAPRKIEPTPPPPKAERRPIDPPSFHLIEDDPPMLERPRRKEYLDEPPLSILDPTPSSEEPDSMGRTVLIIAGVLILVISALSYSGGKHVNRFSPPAAVPVADPAYPVGNGVTAPIVRFKVEPEYTQEARQANIEGTVVLFVEVEPGGRATVRGVLKGLDPGLDERAMDAVRQWRFQPGMKDGQPVKVLAHVEVNFRLP